MISIHSLIIKITLCPLKHCYEHISFDWSLMEPLDYLTNNRYPIEAVVSFSIRHIYVPVFC